MASRAFHVIDVRERQDAAMFDQFVALYESAGFEPELRESPAAWRHRMWGSGSKEGAPQPETRLLVIREGADETRRYASGSAVLGGLMVEYYRDSACGLLTYLVVDEQYRGLGLARRLVNTGFELLRETSRSDRRDLQAVFAETEDATVDGTTRTEAARGRLAVLSKLGAKWIDIPYVQPALVSVADAPRAGANDAPPSTEAAPGAEADESQAHASPSRAEPGRSHHLLLLTFPDGVGRTSVELADQLGPIVASFIDEFYRALGVCDPASDPDVRRLNAALNVSSCLLRELPTVETPAIRFKRAAVSLHLVQQRPDGVDPGQHSAESPCPFFHSFETDLLAHRFQSYGHRPVASECLTMPSTVTLCYPPRIDYWSEGRKMQLVACRTSRLARVALSMSRFPQSGIQVWHLTFTSPAGEPFDEFDIIKLVHLYGGLQERATPMPTVTFKYGDHASGSVAALAMHLIGGGEHSQLDLVAGTVQVQLDRPTGATTWAELATAVNDARGGDAKAEMMLEEWFRRPGQETGILMAVGGVVTEIFDFHRLGTAELEDMLEPTVSGGSDLIRVHRATLSQIGEGDSAFDAAFDSIGISPYLIIPHAALIHNESLVKSVVDALRSDGRSDDIVTLKTTAETATRKLDNDYLPNVFQYSTERVLFERGHISRGSRDQLEHTRRQLGELRERIEGREQLERRMAKHLAEGIAGLLAALAAQSVIFAAFADMGWSKLASWLTFGIALIVIVVAMVYYKLKSE